ncbi:MAG: hypothetical protein N2444_04215, partial [Methylocystis sp.]|nr:hypothetical protein [Methylocystis sp.]
MATFVGLFFVALFLAAAGGFFALLSRGPISFAWLAPRIVQSLQELAGPRYAFALKNSSLANTGHGPTLTVDGLVVQHDGHSILAAPRAQISLDFASLLVGRVKPRRVEALDLEVRLSLRPDGGIDISAGAEPVATPPSSSPVPPPAADVSSAPPNATTTSIPRATLLRDAVIALRELMDLATSPESVIGGLDRVGVLNGRLVIDDRTIDRTIAYDDVALALDKGGGGMRFTLAAKGPMRRWSVNAVAKGTPGGRRDFHAQLRNLSLDEITLFAGVRNPSFDSDAPLGFDLDFALGPDDSIANASGNFEIGRGFFRLDDPDHEPVMIERIVGSSRWDEATRRLVITPLRFDAGGFDIGMSGDVRPATVDGVDTWALSLRLDKPTVVKPARASDKPVEISDAQIAARLFWGQRRAQIDKLSLAGPGANIELGGAVNWSEGVRIALRLGVIETQIPVVTRLWPTHVAPPARAWFMEHVSAGVVKRASYVVELDGAALTAMRYARPPPDASMLLEGDIAGGVVVDVLPGMAPLSGIDGHLRVTGRTAVFTATSGAMDTAQGRRLTLADGRFFVADTGLRPAPALVEMRVAGHVDAIADLLALPAISAHAGLPVDPKTLNGQVEGRLRVEFEIGEESRDEHTLFFVDATASNLTVDKLIGKERLDGATLHVLADKDSLRVNGAGHIFGAPATLELRRQTGDKLAQAQLTLNFDEAARQRAGYVISGVNGPIAVSYTHL